MSVRTPAVVSRRTFRHNGVIVRLALCAAIVAALWIGTSAQTKELRLVSTAWSPFTNAPGQPRYALDLVEAATQRIGVRTTTTIVAPAAFTDELLKGKYDGSAAAWKDISREQVLMYSKPYLQNRLILVGRKGADVSAKQAAALKGKRIAIVEGYSYGDALESSGPTFLRAKNEEESLQKVLKGEADYTLMDDLVVEYILEHYANEARTKLAFGTTPLVTRDLFLAIRRSLPDAQSIIDRFNSQLRAMIVDHTYHKLLNVQWIRADINGDGITEYIPASDKVGPKAPSLAYTLFDSKPEEQKPAAKTPPTTGFYVGGNIYESWAAVPQPYKGGSNEPPDSRRSTASIFTFSW